MSLHPSYHTTYRACYRNPGACVLPPIHHHQSPGLQLPHQPGMLTPRYFPLIPRGPHRRLRREAALGLGLGTTDMDTERHLGKKPIVGTAPPRELGVLNSAPLEQASVTGHTEAGHAATTGRRVPRHVLEELCKRVTWTTTSRRAQEDSCIPIIPEDIADTTCEDNADLVTYRPNKYEAEAGDWQQVADIWDAAQTRARTQHPLNKGAPSLRPCRLLFRRAMKQEKEVTKVSLMERVRQMCSEDSLPATYEKPCPGYAGFRPRSPVEMSLDTGSLQKDTSSSMRQAYRILPAKAYKIHEHAHRGPLSTTVTLTYPYNPFNKVENQLTVCN